MSSGQPFAFVTCQQGAEAPLKDELTPQGWKLAFSRPGLVSFKYAPSAPAAPAPSADPEIQLPRGVFARQASWSLGRVTAGDTNELALRLIELLECLKVEQPASAWLPQFPLDYLHVWSRDRLPVGERSYQPQLEPLTNAVAEEILPRLIAAELVSSSSPNVVVEQGKRALDIVLTDPNQWMVGWHEATSSLPTRWPGAFPPLDWNHEVVSRAYFKAAEALLWSGLPIRPGDTVVEIGSAPGGAAQHLLELGLKVIGVDPAEMDPEIAEHPNFHHLKARGGDVKRSEYRDARWLLVDSNVRPDKTLVTVENIVLHRQVDIRGMLLTMKLGRYDQADRIYGWCRTLRKWGYTQLRVRQLATGRCEVCIAAKKSGRRKKPPTSPRQET